MQLIEADSSQGDAETSHADVAEVIHVSSDSEPLATQKTQRVIQKVKILILLLTWIPIFF